MKNLGEHVKVAAYEEKMHCHGNQVSNLHLTIQNVISQQPVKTFGKLNYVPPVWFQLCAVQ